MVKLVLFDFDGTLADTSEGILDAHCFTLRLMDRKVPSENQLQTHIGGNLLSIYKDEFGFEEKSARDAIKIYRQRYEEKGIHKAVLYEGIENLLKSLKKEGILLGIATLKAEIFVKQMLKEMEIIDYFDVICGMDCNDTLNKSSLILKCMEQCKCTKDQTLFIGDSINDYTGSRDAKVRFVGVTYGFGFIPDMIYEFETKNTVESVLDYLLEECNK